MKTKHEIILSYLYNETEIEAHCIRYDKHNNAVTHDCFINLICKNNVYYLLLREISSENGNYFDNGYDKKEEKIFDEINKLKDFLKLEMGLDIVDFKKCKQFRQFKNIHN
jgi:hypothetical protein